MEWNPDPPASMLKAKDSHLESQTADSQEGPGRLQRPEVQCRFIFNLINGHFFKNVFPKPQAAEAKVEGGAQCKSTKA